MRASTNPATELRLSSSVESDAPITFRYTGGHDSPTPTASRLNCSLANTLIPRHASDLPHTRPPLLECRTLLPSPCPQRMGVASVAFALKLTQGNRVGLAASETSPPPSRAGTGPATAEQQQVVRSPFPAAGAGVYASIYKPVHLPAGAVTSVALAYRGRGTSIALPSYDEYSPCIPSMMDSLAYLVGSPCILVMDKKDKCI